VAPSQAVARLRGITQQQINLCRAEIAPVDGDEDIAGTRIDPLLLHAAANPLDVSPDTSERDIDKFANGMRFSGGQHIIVRPLLLYNKPHSFDVIALMPPIALRIEIAKI